MSIDAHVPRRTWLFLGLAVLAGSQSANLIRLGHAHAVAIAAWRLFIATAVLAPFALRQSIQIPKRTVKEKLLVALAGVVLALHFFAWISAVQHTTVANAALLFSINPLLSAIGGWLVLGERVTKRLAVSVGLGFLGIAIVTAGDLRFEKRHLLGDGLALLSAALFTTYALLGRRLRRDLPNVLYVTMLYSAATLVAFTALIALHEPLITYDARTWLCFTLMALVPTLIGHTGINHALRYLDAARVAMVFLLEPLISTLVAAWAWNEPITVAAMAGYGLIALGVAVLLQPKS